MSNDYVFNAPKPLTILMYDNAAHLRREAILPERRESARPFIKFSGWWYLWNPASLADDDGEAVIKPDSIPADHDGRWIRDELPTGGGSGTPSDTVEAESFGAAGDAGASDEYSRGDHVHEMPADPVPAHELAFDHGNLPTDNEKEALVGTDGTPSAYNPFVTDSDPRLGAGGTPSDTVEPESFGAVGDAGDSLEFSRGDHVHAMPEAPEVPAAGDTVEDEEFGSINDPGASDEFSRADHVHGMPAAPVQNGYFPGGWT